MLSSSRGNRCLMCALAVFAASSVVVQAGGTVTGHGRVEKIKGQPQMGYLELYECDLFLSPLNSPPTGPSRRLGASPGEPITYDGYYSISGMPGAATYSILVDTPVFFVRPKVVSNVSIVEGQTTTAHVELPIDFSTYFKTDWTSPDTVWYQTFTATGTSVTGVSVCVAGTGASSAEIAILQYNGNPDVRNWTVLGSRMANSFVAMSDNWARWRSGEIPTTSGIQYAVRVTGGGGQGFQPFKRNKDSNSYVGGQAYNASGVAQSYDLNYIVFSDNDGTRITMNKRSLGTGDLQDNNYGQRWGQTFTAGGTSLAAADVWAAGAGTWDLDFTWKVRAGGPTGTVISPTKTTKAAFLGSGVGLHGVSFSPGEVPLTFGQTYFVEFTNSPGFNPYVMTGDSYSGGIAYQDNTARSDIDLSMMIMEYTGTDPGNQPNLINGDFSDGLEGWGVWNDRGTFTPTVDGNGRLCVQGYNINGGVYQQFTTGGPGNTIGISGWWASNPTVANSQWAEVLIINGQRIPETGVDVADGQADVVLIYKNDTWTTPAGWAGQMSQTAPVVNVGSFVSADNVATIVLKTGNIVGPTTGAQFDDIVIGPAAPTIGCSPTTLTPSCQQGSNAASQTFAVQNTGTGTLSYSISDDAAWLSCSPSSGTSTGEADTITVTYATSGLTAGTYYASISVSDSGATNSPQTVDVTLTVSPPPPTITRSPATLSPSCWKGSNATSQTFTVQNTGGGTLNYSISDNQTWLSVTPASGTSTGEADTITVNYATSSLSAGTHNATITISDPAATNNPQTIAVTLTVTARPTITRSPATLTPSCSQGSNASSQTFTVQNTGGSTLSYSITDNQTWLSVTPTSGTSTGEVDTITVNYTTSGLAAGTYYATITISDANATNNPQTIAVTLTVNPVKQTVAEDFGAMPAWSSSYNASWGSAATWSIVSGGQSGNCLQASRSSQGSSVKAKVYSITASQGYTISIYLKCPSHAGSYWMESAYRLGSHGAQDFDQNPGNWTLIQKFDNSGTNGNGNVWTQYSKTFNSGGSTQITVGYKLGSYGGSGPVVRWDTLRIQ
ncbi:MAG: hypothetical protein GX616_12725 [Planctomycetes bacterium]|nr:hypothetical protein [Planctomycetota bacterium]